MSENISLGVWQNMYSYGSFDSNNYETMIKAGWYDWFCDLKSLKGRLTKMSRIVLKLRNSSKINLDTMYVSFNNKCPLEGELYDEINISDSNTGITLYTICINAHHVKEEYNAKYSIWSLDNKYEIPLYYCNTSKELIEWFNQ